MPNIPILSFNGGEMTPKCDVRSDVEKYQNSCRHLEDFLPLIYGCAERRPGTKYIATVPIHQYEEALAGVAVVRKIPFIFSSEVAYEVELTDRYARFFYNDELITEITTPYLAADLFQIQYQQVGDVMRLVHPSYRPYKLTRTDPYTFSLDVIPFKKGPFLTRNDLIDPDQLYTAFMVSSVTDVDDIGTLTCQDNDTPPNLVAFFVEGHIGALFKLTQKRVTTTTSGSKANASGLPYTICAAIDIKGTFSFNTHGTWKATIVLQRNENNAEWEDFRTYIGKNDRNVQFSATEDEDNVQYRAVVTAWTSGTIETDITSNNSIQEGIVQIDSLDLTYPDSIANVTVITKLASTDATRRWAEGAWSAVRGYPSSVTFFEERCVYGGMIEIPTQVAFDIIG